MQEKPELLVTVTIGEVATLINELEDVSRSAAWSERRTRYLLDAVLPRHGQGHTRRCAVEDVMLVRLANRLIQGGLSSWHARALVAIFDNEIRETWRRGLPRALVVRGLRAMLANVGDGKPLNDGSMTVDLKSLREGVSEAMRRVRAAQPAV